MPLYNMIRSKVADADATSSSWSDAASSAGSDDGVEVELRGAAGANGIPPMDELVAVMGEARAVVATYLEQAVLARLLRRRGGGSRGAGGVETFEERAAEVQGIKDRLAAVGALGHYATTLGKTPAGAAGAGSGARTRMLLRGKEVEVRQAGAAGVALQSARSDRATASFRGFQGTSGASWPNGANTLHLEAPHP